MSDLPAGTWVVVPAYNEERTIERVLRELCLVCDHVVVVDDGSADQTYAAALRVTPYALRHAINRGQGAALQTGIEFALLQGASVVCTFDADGQHCTDDLAALVQPIMAGECDIVLGSRFLGRAEDIPPLRRLCLKAGILFTRMVSRVRLTDVHNGLRAFSRRAAERVEINNDRMAHASELIDIVRDTGLPFREVPVRIRYTDYSLAKGQSVLNSFRILFDYVVDRVTS